ncbi:MAG TPA: hypothetical protein ENN43_04755 [bacterium]|nr:hypothetical protein [bacterium]
MRKIHLILMVLISTALFASERAVEKGAAGITEPAASESAAPEAPVTEEPAEKNMAPKNINASPAGPDTVNLGWAKIEEAEHYNVYRLQNGQADFIRANTYPVKAEVFSDKELVPGTEYFYVVETVDRDGAGYRSATVSVKTGNVNPPGNVAEFRALQDIQSVRLRWSQAAKGSYDVSGYNIYRGMTEKAAAKYRFVPAHELRFEDTDVEPAARYFYRVSAVDIKGGESKLSPVRAVVPFPAPRTGLILTSTSYRNNIHDNFGLNVDMFFTYYIGVLFGAHDANDYTDAGNDTIDKIGVWLLGVDLKGTVVEEREPWPSLGLGFTYKILLQDQIGSTDTRSVSQSFTAGSSLNKMYGFYLTAGKKIIFDTHLHLGYMLGMGSEAQTNFMPYLSKHISIDEQSTGVRVKEANNAYYIGLGRPLFDRMGIKVEYIVPWEANENPLIPDYYLINTQIDRFMNFNIGYFHFPGGYSWLGYINFRFTVFPNPYK